MSALFQSVRIVKSLLANPETAIKISIPILSQYSPHQTVLENLISFGAPRTSISWTSKLNPNLWPIVTPTNLFTLRPPHQASHLALHNLIHIYSAQSWGCVRVNQKQRPPKLWFPQYQNHQLMPLWGKSRMCIINPAGHAKAVSDVLLLFTLWPSVFFNFLIKVC